MTSLMLPVEVRAPDVVMENTQEETRLTVVIVGVTDAVSDPATTVRTWVLVILGYPELLYRVRTKSLVEAVDAGA